MTHAAALDGDRGFEQFVDDLARKLVGLSPTFEAFVASLPGVLPDEALAALRRIGGCDADRLASDAHTDRAGATIDQCALLPLPHPLDSEFRFDTTTAHILATALVSSTKAGDEILLVGVPSVAVELGLMDVDRCIRFLGPDNCVTQAVKSAIKDERLMLDQGPGRTAAAALVDPPWYYGPMAELIEVCAAGCREGAIVTLILPPTGTRPEIAEDRSSYLAAATRAGLKPTDASGPAYYRTPLFELAALERQGIARLASWRRGEALEFVATGAVRPRRWDAPVATELSVSGVRLRLIPGMRAGGAQLQSVDSHEIFPSVSARAPGRSRATLWTTTNRAFAIDYDLARAALSEIAAVGSDSELLPFGFSQQQNDPSAPTSVAVSDGLIHQLIELIGRELNDARRLVGEGAWLETGMDWRS
ncbi:MAG: hypothetical protein M3Q19_11030 [Pseudomonadota bacterium]|nr:hypothetical protein [Pseudomonadota bacterium]